MLDLKNGCQVATILGVVFLIAAALGFVPNPIVGAHGFFVTNHAHDMVHALAGVVLILGGKMGFGKEVLLAFGVAYILVAMLGYMTMGKNDMLFGLVRMNMADHYLHILLGVVLILAGAVVRKGKA